MEITCLLHAHISYLRWVCGCLTQLPGLTAVEFKFVFLFKCVFVLRGMPRPPGGWIGKQLAYLARAKPVSGGRYFPGGHFCWHNFHTTLFTRVACKYWPLYYSSPLPPPRSSGPCRVHFVRGAICVYLNTRDAIYTHTDMHWYIHWQIYNVHP